MIEVISSFQATSELWKSTLWGSLLVAGFLRWIRMRSPCFTRMTGPGSVPPNVQTAWLKPSATVMSFSSMTRSMSCVSPGRSSGAVGSTGAYFGAAGSGWTSVTGAGPPWLSVSALPASPLTEMVPVMPASAWPGMEHRNARPLAGTSTTADAVSPAWASIFWPSGNVMSWMIVPVLTSLTS